MSKDEWRVMLRERDDRIERLRAAVNTVRRAIRELGRYRGGWDPWEERVVTRAFAELRAAMKDNRCRSCKLWPATHTVGKDLGPTAWRVMLPAEPGGACWCLPCAEARAETNNQEGRR